MKTLHTRLFLQCSGAFFCFTRQGAAQVAYKVINDCTAPAIPTLAETANTICIGNSTTLSIQAFPVFTPKLQRHKKSRAFGLALPS